MLHDNVTSNNDIYIIESLPNPFIKVEKNIKQQDEGNNF